MKITLLKIAFALLISLPSGGGANAQGFMPESNSEDPVAPPGKDISCEITFDKQSSIWTFTKDEAPFTYQATEHGLGFAEGPAKYDVEKRTLTWQAASQDGRYEGTYSFTVRLEAGAEIKIIISGSGTISFTKHPTAHTEVVFPATLQRIGVAETIHQVGGVDAARLTPGSPWGTLILLAGDDGCIEVGPNGRINNLSLRNNQLVRTRLDYVARRYVVLLPDCGVDLAAAVQQTPGWVTVVATSRGTVRAAEGLRDGATPARLVLTSGFLSRSVDPNVIKILGTPEKLPATLVVEHVNDACRWSRLEGVQPFVDWANAPQFKAEKKLLEGGTNKDPEHPCNALTYHGFYGIDDQVVSKVSDFAAHDFP